MRNYLSVAILERCISKEIEYHSVKIGTKSCHLRGLAFGISFYGAVKLQPDDVVRYKRIEVWFPSCPNQTTFDKLHKFFKAYPPKCNNALFAYVNNELYFVES